MVAVWHWPRLMAQCSSGTHVIMITARSWLPRARTQRARRRRASSSRPHPPAVLATWWQPVEVLGTRASRSGICACSKRRQRPSWAVAVRLVPSPWRTGLAWPPCTPTPHACGARAETWCSQERAQSVEPKETKARAALSPAALVNLQLPPCERPWAPKCLWRPSLGTRASTRSLQAALTGPHAPSTIPPCPKRVSCFAMRAPLVAGMSRRETWTLLQRRVAPSSPRTLSPCSGKARKSPASGAASASASVISRPRNRFSPLREAWALADASPRVSSMRS
mmetsp:Transcript_30321/g.81528  ORF Transcript_30321/g.81528 Transcript_30321/m.81528 type:complete len:280 (+) Transcript_30321:908-1747(+)